MSKTTTYYLQTKDGRLLAEDKGVPRFTRAHILANIYHTREDAEGELKRASEATGVALEVVSRTR